VFLEGFVNFCERIAELKSKKKLFQKDIAKAINVSVRQFLRYEKGEQQPTLPVIIALADFFDVSIDYLVGRSDNPKRL
jgi:transcriptional regulator with XRE-family HTH domain